MIVVPEAFAAATRRREGAAGAAWIEQLPLLVDHLLRTWDLALDGPIRHGYVAVVLPVRCADGRPAALKVSWTDGESRHEPLALRRWGGRGAVTLLRATPAHTAMLLERLDAERSLLDVAEDAALACAAAVLRRLHVRASRELAAQLPSTADVASRWQQELPARWSAARVPSSPLWRADLLPRVVAACAVLARSPGRPVLVHGDFHYANVLADLRAVQWSAIDPKPLTGDGEFDLLPLLRNRWEEVAATGDPVRACRRRLDRLIGLTGLDPRRARDWALARTVDDALWGIEHDQSAFTSTAWTIADALR